MIVRRPKDVVQSEPIFEMGDSLIIILRFKSELEITFAKRVLNETMDHDIAVPDLVRYLQAEVEIKEQVNWSTG